MKTVNNMSHFEEQLGDILKGPDFQYSGSWKLHGVPQVVLSNISGMVGIISDAIKYSRGQNNTTEQLQGFRIAGGAFGKHPSPVKRIPKESFKRLQTLKGLYYADENYEVMLSDVYMNSIHNRKNDDVLIYFKSKTNRFPKVLVWMMASRVILRTNIALSMRLPSLVAVHGASVAWGRDGCLLVGMPGSGKTTTALACVRRGASMLSEDISGIRLDGLQWYILAMPSMPGLTCVSAELLGISLKDIVKPEVIQDTHKIWVPSGKLVWLNRTHRARLKAIFTVELISGAKSEIIKCKKTDSLHMMLDSSTRALVSSSLQVAAKVSGIAKAIEQVVTYKVLVPKGRPYLAVASIRKVMGV